MRRGIFCISGENHVGARLSKNLLSRKFRREGKCERKPSGCPFASNNPPQRQNCKIMLQNLILQFGKQLGEKRPEGTFLTSRGEACLAPAPRGRPVLSSIKTIASVAAVSDRLAGWHYLRHKFIGAMPQVCHSEERSDVGISQYHVGSWESYRRNRDCLPEIATSAAPPRNDNSGGPVPFWR